MDRHVDLLGLLHRLVAGLSALVAASLFVLGLGAASLAWGSERGMAASVTAAMFFAIAAVLAVWAVLNWWVGRELRRGGGPIARWSAIVLALAHLLVLPFGTALGVYSLWVLLHDDVRRRFEAPAAPSRA
jgi:hypothetical protein